MRRLKVFVILLFSVLIMVACSGGNSSDATDHEIASNTPPVANAGANQSVKTGLKVTLNGSGSSDADGDLLTYSWDMIEAPNGSTTSLSSTTVVNPSFTPNVAGTYRITLTVNDGIVDSTAVTVVIEASIANSAPVADAGSDQNVNTTSTVTLDGSGSSDADGDPLTYSWSISTKPDTSNASLIGADTDSPTFVADFDGKYVVQLIVNDGTDDSNPSTVTVTAETANSIPVADAGEDQSVTTGELVTLDGSNSTDADFDTLTYSWSFTSVADGSIITTNDLSDSTAVSPTFTPDVNGTYVAQLIVNDGTLNSAPDTVTIVVSLGTCWKLISGQELDINQTLGAQNAMMVSETTSNKLYVSWLEDSVFQVKSYDVTSGTWSYMGGLGEAVYINALAHLRIDPSDGLPYAYYAQSDRSRNLDKWNGTSWQQEYTTDYYSFLDGDNMTLNNSGNPVLVGLHGDHDLNFKSYNNGTWSDDVPPYIHSGDYNRLLSPDIEVAPDGTIFVSAWYVNNSISGYYHEKTYMYTTGWQSLGYLENSIPERQAVCATMIIDQEGRPVVAYAEKNAPNVAVYGPVVNVKRYNGTDGWNLIGDTINGVRSVNIANMQEGAGMIDGCVSLTEDALGNLYVAWQHEEGSERGIYVQKYDGSTWSDAADYLLEDQKLRAPSLAIDAQGRINMSVLYDSTPNTTDMDDVKVYRCEP